MSYPNLGEYTKIEKAIRKVGEARLKEYLAFKGHKVNKFERNMQIIKYAMQHGPYAAAKVFHLSGSYPSALIYLYGQMAFELLEIMEKEKKM